MRACVSLDPSKEIKIDAAGETVLAKVDFILILNAEQKRKEKQGLSDMEAAYLGRVQFDTPSLTFVRENKGTKSNFKPT